MSAVLLRTTRRGRLLWLVVVAALAMTISVLTAGRASASPLGDAAANLALRNQGKTACGTNSLGGAGFYSSCTGGPEEWCADFAKWVWANTGAIVGGLDARAGSFYTYGANNGTLHTSSGYRPVPGDAVVYDYQGNSSANHVGIVTRVYADGSFQSANGNGGSGSGPANTSVSLSTTPASQVPAGSYVTAFDYHVSAYVSPKPGANAPVDPPTWPSLAEPGRITSARSDDGRLEVFASSATGVSHAWQTKVNGSWSAWRNEGGPANAQLSIARNSDGRLELFALNGSVMMHKYQLKDSGEWSDWETSFGTGGDYVVAGNNADGRIEVFASNPNGVFHKWQTGPTTWSAWAGMPGGGPASAKLQVEQAPDGRLELFAMNSSTFWHTFQIKPSGDFAPQWETTFGGGGDWLSVDHNDDGRLEVFASSYAGVFHKYQKSATTWSGWENTSGPAGSAKLTTTRNADGRVELFTMNGSDAEHLFQKAPNQQYGAWETNFGGAGTQVQAVNDQDGRIEIFGASSAGVFHKYQTGFSTWSTWEPVNGPGPSIP